MSRGGGSRRRGRVAGLLPECVVFAVALLTRVGVVATSGGLSGKFTYDASVYYAAADALTFGRLPYRGFVLLHPPGIMLALTPFAWLGRTTSDHIGFMSADVAFMVLGAVNAVLVVRVGRKIGLPAWAAGVGGVFYAVWLGSVDAEYLIRLEPLGNLLILLGLLAHFSGHRTSSRRAALLTGLAFGAAASVKIWWSASLILLLIWQIARGRRRDALQTAIGATIAMVVVNGPFFLAAPADMWHMVVTEQLGRFGNHGSLLYRARAVTGLGWAGVYWDRHVVTGVALALLALAVAVLVIAWRSRTARLVVVLTIGQAIVLAAAPSWFGFYADYLAPVAALSVACAAGAHTRRRHSRPARRSRLTPVAATIVAVLITGGFLASGRNHAVTPFPATRLAAAVSGTRCVMSDSPMGLILLDSLSRDLRHGCRDWVDVTGRTYGVDKAVRPDGRHVPRHDNTRWNRDLLAYLRSGDAVIVVRRYGSGITPPMMATLRRGGVLARAGQWVVYRTPHRGTRSQQRPSRGRRRYVAARAR